MVGGGERRAGRSFAGQPCGVLAFREPGPVDPISALHAWEDPGDVVGDVTLEDAHGSQACFGPSARCRST